MASSTKLIDISPVSLLDELRSLLDLAIGTERIRCHGINKKPGDRCGNWLSTASKKNIQHTLLAVLSSLEAGQEVEELVKTLSSLTLCVRRHQYQAQAISQKWTDKVRAWNLLESPKIRNIQVNNSTLSLLSSNRQDSKSLPVVLLDATISSVPIDEKEPEAITQWNLKTSLQPPISARSSQLITTPLLEDDPGYVSDNEQPSTKKEPLKRSGIQIDNLPLSEAVPATRTPTRPPLTVSTDSAISMGYDDTLGTNAKQSRKTENELESPIRARSREKKVISLPSKSRPPPLPLYAALAPAQSAPASSIVAQNSEPGPRSAMKFSRMGQWAHWKTSVLLKEVIQKPFKIKDRINGFIYGFQIPDCKYIKIGRATRRKNMSTPVSLCRRMDEHKYCGWIDLTMVIQERLTIPAVMEKIIHGHLYEDRYKQVEMPMGANGKICKHKSHREWFDVSVERANKVVRAWKRWSETSPFIEEDGLMKLSRYWEERLEYVAIESPGDHWMEWLDYYVPEMSVKPVKEENSPSDDKFHVREAIKESSTSLNSRQDDSGIKDEKDADKKSEYWDPDDKNKEGLGQEDFDEEDGEWLPAKSIRKSNAALNQKLGIIKDVTPRRSPRFLNSA